MNIQQVKFNRKDSRSYYVKQSFTYGGDDYFDWCVWIESADEKKLDNILSVTYHLHNTYPNPVRVVTNRDTNFKLDASGWGIFTIYIVINLKDDSVIELKHKLLLEYPDNEDAETK